MKQYTHENIPGVLPRMLLPQNWGLVLEGGGTRGAFSAGVLDRFLQDGLMFSYIVGISAGAASGLSYVSGQKGRNKLVFQHHIPLKKYMGIGNFMEQKSYINRDYVFRELQEEHLFFDWQAFRENRARFLAGAFDCQQGDMAWFGKDEMGEDCLPIVATTAVPFVSPMVEIRGKKLLDGGIMTPIPIEKSVKDGNEFHIIVLTKNKGYRKIGHPFQSPQVPAVGYSKVMEALSRRNKSYNDQLDLCYQLQRQGKAIILQPRAKLEVGRLDQNQRRLLKLYEEGELEAKTAVKTIRNMLKLP